MKRIVITLVIILILSALLLFASIFGLKVGSTNIPSIYEGITLDLDLVGGSELSYTAIIPEGTSKEKIDEGIDMLHTLMRQRLDSMGYKNAMIYLDKKTHVFTVDIPHENNPEKLAQELNKPSIIKFVDYNGNILLDSSDVLSATAEYGSVDDTDVLRRYITVFLTQEGYEKFKAATKEIAAFPEGSNYLEVKMDDMVISQPVIEPKFADTGINSNAPKLVLVSSATEEYANYIAKLISSGNSSFELQRTTLSVIDATFGDNSLKTIIYGLIFGLILIMVYMVIVYRIPGVVTDAVLLLFVSLFLFVMSISKLTLSLYGIAGIILSLSLYIDTNIIIFSRMREELISGNSLDNAVTEAFKRADNAIIDTNIPLIIISVVILWVGPDSVTCFARTLLFGFVLSLICIRFFTKSAMKSLTKTPYKSLKSFGA